MCRQCKRNPLIIFGRALGTGGRDRGGLGLRGGLIGLAGLGCPGWAAPHFFGPAKAPTRSGHEGGRSRGRTLWGAEGALMVQG